MPSPHSPVPPPVDPSPGGPAPPGWAVLPLPRGTPAEPPARDWLARQLELAPATLPLQRDARGRPRLGGRLAGFDCNWSHSGERLLVALGRDLQVGIDVEREHARPRALALARRFFHPDEARWLATQPPGHHRDRAFLRLWCAKEAILKAHGHGLAFGLHRLRLEERDGTLRLVECDRALGEPAQWALQELAPGDGYLGALAWRPRPLR